LRAEIKRRKADKVDAIVHLNCDVSWLEWYGSRRHPKCDECHATNATVTVKGKTATIETVDGTFTKRLTTRGFSFWSRTEAA